MTTNVPTSGSSRRSRWQTGALWCIGAGLLANALAMVWNRPGSGQYPSDSFGLYLLDLDAGNIVVYKALPDNNRFHLMAARNFRNDRFLEDFNNDSPTPKEVQKLIQQQRQRQDLGGETPAPGATPPTITPVPPG
jgi:hypothetical protein